MADESPKMPAPPTSSLRGVQTSLPAPPQPLALALRDPNVARIYANGFTLGLSNADVHIVWQFFGRPVGLVNMSYTLAKTVSLQLQQLVRDWEQKTNQTLQTTESIENSFRKAE